MNLPNSLLRATLLIGALAFSSQAGAQADPQTKATLENVHTRNVVSMNYAAIAAQKATTPALRELAARVRDDHVRLDQEIEAIAAERGIELTPDVVIAHAPQFQPGYDQLNAVSGPAFDRVYAQMLLTDRLAQVDDFKALRARTPGEDARLKEWLDQAENLMEEHRNQARIAQKEVQSSQRQGRAPPR